VPDGPGLGVTPDLQAIDEVTTFKEEIIWQTI